MSVQRTTKPKVILIVGPQGSGKGTQAELLAKRRRKLVYLPLGVVLRQEVSSGTALGKRAAWNMRTGKMLPDDVVNQVVVRTLARPAARRYGVLLDGYPRNVSQAVYLDRYGEVTDVIALTLTDREALRRLGGRRVCSVCGRGYHTLYKKPKRAGICDICRGKLIVRPDDRSAAIRRRLAIFRRQTQPLLRRYRQRGLVRAVDAAPPIPRVFGVVVRELERKRKSEKVKT